MLHGAWEIVGEEAEGGSGSEGSHYMTDVSI